MGYHAGRFGLCWEYVAGECKVLYIAVCEDSLSEIAQIETLLNAYQAAHPELRLQTEMFKTAEQLLQALKAGKGYDVFLLDILLPGMDGIALSRELRAKGSIGVIIFLTATRDYAFEAFGVRAADYLLKPLVEKEMFLAMDRAVEELSSREEASYTLVKTTESDRIINLADIVAVEVQGHTLCYYLASGEVLKSKVLRVSFSSATASLMADARFIKPHQSFLINAGHVSSVSQKKFIMDNGMDIPVSRLRYTEVKNQYMDYLSRRGDIVRSLK